MKRRTIAAIAIIFLVVLVSSGYLVYTHYLISALINNGTITSSDGSVVLHIPDGTHTAGMRITFKTNPSAAKSLKMTLTRNCKPI